MGTQTASSDENMTNQQLQIQIEQLRAEVGELRAQLALVKPEAKYKVKPPPRPLASNRDVLEWARSALDAYGDLSHVADTLRSSNLTASPLNFNARGIRLARERMSKGMAIAFDAHVPREQWAESLGLAPDGIEAMQ
jgi:hypothetical protein